MTAPSDQIWAYLHNELDPEKKERFEQALQSDPDLQAALKDCQATHKELVDIMPLLNEAPDSGGLLEDRLLSEWETIHPEYSETPVQKPNRKIIRFSLPLAAAAAAAFLLLTLPSQQRPVDWLKTDYGTTPQLRGQVDSASHYSRAELKQINQELQEVIEASLVKLSDTTKPWTLKIDLQELANGALAVEISGYPHNTKQLSMIWSGNFDSLENFRGNVPLLGSQVVENLAERNDL